MTRPKLHKSGRSLGCQCIETFLFKRRCDAVDVGIAQVKVMRLQRQARRCYIVVAVGRSRALTTLPTTPSTLTSTVCFVLRSINSSSNCCWERTRKVRGRRATSTHQKTIHNSTATRIRHVLELPRTRRRADAEDKQWTICSAPSGRH